MALYDLETARKLVIQAGLKLQQLGLIARTWGNISARISDSQFVITPSGRSYETLTPEQIVIVNISDCSYEGDIKPSSEKLVHAAAYKARPQAQFIIHTHQNFASAISILGRPVRQIGTLASSAAGLLPDVDNADDLRSVLGDEVPCAEYGSNGSIRLMNNVSRALLSCPSADTVLMQNHGVLCTGSSFEHAFRLAASLETAACLFYLQMTAAANNPDPLRQAVLKTFRGGIDLTTLTLTDTAFSPDGSSRLLRARIRSPFLLEACRRADVSADETVFLRPYIDDQAQCIGADLPCIHIRGWNEDGSTNVEDASRIRSLLREHNGILCVADSPSDSCGLLTGSNKDDLTAAAIVLEKGCIAAVLAGFADKARPLTKEEAAMDRKVYVESYSRLKNA